jgi:hypothetical protein
MEVELLLQALRKSAALVIPSSRYFVKDVGQMTWILLIYSCFKEYKRQQTWAF